MQDSLSHLRYDNRQCQQRHELGNVEEREGKRIEIEIVETNREMGYQMTERRQEIEEEKETVKETPMKK
jgi:hypothetical protein